MALIPCLIAGCGPGARRWITPEVQEAAMTCDLLAGVPSLLDLFPTSPAKRLPYASGLPAFLKALEPHLGHKAVTVLVSGDPGLASLASTLTRTFPHHPFRRLAGLSSVQVAFAECGLDHTNVRVIRAHGSLPPWDPTWAFHQGPFAVLTGHPWAPSLTAALARRLHRSHLWRCERLGRANQRIQRIDVPTLLREGCDPMSILIVEGVHP